MCVSVFVHFFELQHPQESGGPNLLSTENEDCAVNGDPMAHFHKDSMATASLQRQLSSEEGKQSNFDWINITSGKARLL